jgi:hypothetical protein
MYLSTEYTALWLYEDKFVKTNPKDVVSGDLKLSHGSNVILTKYELLCLVV